MMRKILWISLFIILGLLHAPFVWVLINIIPTATISYMAIYIPLLTPLVFSYVIIDNITFALFKRQTPQWKTNLLWLGISNVLFFLVAAYMLIMSAWSIFILAPLTVPLVIIDLSILLSYIFTRHPKGKAKAVSYTFLIILSLILVYLYMTMGVYYTKYIMNKIQGPTISQTEALKLINECKVKMVIRRIDVPDSYPIMYLKDDDKRLLKKNEDMEAIRLAAQNANTICGNVHVLDTDNSEGGLKIITPSPRF